jgi:YHS domain-containing protein
MKRIILFIAITAMCAACNNSGDTSTTTFNTKDSVSKTEETKLTLGIKIDPVCEMEQDTSWTEYTVYKGDTVKFCSDVCKGVFMKNPDKYASKLH